ncbi:MAG: biotin--[acetyl-CoA-carboxylase] ligase [Synechococcales cyanobacterium H12SWP_bin.12]|nr:biotin--[acetyl-CoA-carboxylase] ligase [Synechococcales cyanobacterium H12SWP_bin.12]
MVATAVLNHHQRAGGVIHRLRRHQADGWRLKCKPVCASTELELSQWLQSVPWRGERPRAVLADHQTRGQGQHGRRWEAARGGVWISAALPWDSSSGHADMLGLMVALALSERLERKGLPVRIKWPNDLLIDSRKLAGLLPRLVFRGGHLRMVRIGVGMNVANPAPVGAIALRDLLPRGCARRDVWTVEVLRALERIQTLANRPELVRREIEKRLWVNQVKDPQSGEIWEIQGLALNGALQLCQGARSASWTRWPDGNHDNL